MEFSYSLAMGIVPFCLYLQTRQDLFPVLTLPIAKKKISHSTHEQDSSFLSFRQTGEKEENQYKINIKPTVVRIEHEKNHTSFFE